MKEAEETFTSDIQSTVTESGTVATGSCTKEARMSALYNKVKHCLDVEKVFLNPKLSLAKFSLIVGTGISHLST